MHMEEDAGKLIHDEWEDCSLVDYNRSGVPLIEIVSEPDMRTAEEVIAYLEKLRMICQYLGISDCKLQEGSSQNFPQGISHTLSVISLHECVLWIFL